MKLIVGLGNPGDVYAKNRHNIGFQILDTFVSQNQLPGWRISNKTESLVIKEKDYILLKPQTFMNNTGKAVAKLFLYYKLEPQDLWVIYDDLDLNVGRIKVQSKGSQKSTHKGLKSVIENLGFSDFPRFRFGIAGRDYQLNRIPAENYVLKNYGLEEEKQIEKVMIAGATLIKEALSRGVDKVQSQNIDIL